MKSAGVPYSSAIPGGAHPAHGTAKAAAVNGPTAASAVPALAAAPAASLPGATSSALPAVPGTTWAAAPACRGERRAQIIRDTLGRLWGWQAGDPCAFKDQGGRPVASGNNATAVTWEAAPACAGLPSSTDSVQDSEGRPWGWQEGKSCALRTAAPLPRPMPAGPVPKPAPSAAARGGGAVSSWLKRLLPHMPFVRASASATAPAGTSSVAASAPRAKANAMGTVNGAVPAAPVNMPHATQTHATARTRAPLHTTPALAAVAGGSPDAPKAQAAGAADAAAGSAGGGGRARAPGAAGTTAAGGLSAKIRGATSVGPTAPSAGVTVPHLALESAVVPAGGAAGAAASGVTAATAGAAQAPPGAPWDKAAPSGKHATMPECTELPTEANSVRDSWGRLWGWQEGAACRYP
jgi:hypothetical protein